MRYAMMGVFMALLGCEPQDGADIQKMQSRIQALEENQKNIITALENLLKTNDLQNTAMENLSGSITHQSNSIQIITDILRDR
jgi:hypothetical protein